jgi:polyphosphate kinase 2
MIKKFYNFINEELRIDKLDKETVDQLKINLMSILSEYRTYILANIEYNLKTNKVEYRNFDKIDIPVILRELNNEFTEEVIKDLNIESLLIKLNQILELKRRDTKKRIREEFDVYCNSINDRISKIHKGEEVDHFDELEGEGSLISRKQYETEKYGLQIELLKLQEWVVKNNKKVAIVFEGRDASGKGSTIKRFTEYLNPRGFKIVALGLPTEEEKNNWFPRYEKHLPKPGEIVFFDRSWYNRGVVEPALGYCTEEQYKDFMDNVIDWEENLIKNEDIILIKFWFSITKEKQLSRFEFRKSSPLKYWKFSPNDEKVVDKWDTIGKYKNQMFTKTSSGLSPWVIVNTVDKRIGRLNAIRYVLSYINYDGKSEELCKYYPEVINVIK